MIANRGQLVNEAILTFSKLGRELLRKFPQTVGSYIPDKLVWDTRTDEHTLLSVLQDTRVPFRISRPFDCHFRTPCVKYQRASKCARFRSLKIMEQLMSATVRPQAKTVAFAAKNPRVTGLYANESGEYNALMHPNLRHTRTFCEEIARFAEMFDTSTDIFYQEMPKDAKNTSAAADGPVSEAGAGASCAYMDHEGVVMDTSDEEDSKGAYRLGSNATLLNAMCEAFCVMLDDVFKWPSCIGDTLRARVTGKHERDRILVSWSNLRSIDHCIADMASHFPVLRPGDTSDGHARFAQLFLLIVARCDPDNLEEMARVYLESGKDARPKTMNQLEEFAGTVGFPIKGAEFKARNYTIRAIASTNTHA